MKRPGSAPASPRVGKVRDHWAEIVVRILPRAGRDALEGWDPEGVLRVRVAAPPVAGAANRALLRLLSDVLGVPASAITIVAGEAARTKRLRVAGIDQAELRSRLAGS